MTGIEYEQKKAECWENFKFARRPLNTDKKIFDFIFDRAYTLGKQEKDAEFYVETNDYDQLVIV